MKPILIAPSLLSANFANLGQEILDLESSGYDFLHIDVMDGNFVPNLTFGAPVIKHLRSLTKKIFDVHLMVINPQNYIDDFANAGADIITFHIEATNHPLKIINQIKKHNIKAGIAINPATNEDTLKYLITEVDLILVMSVNPGFGGQEFISSSLDKIKNIKSMLKEYNKENDVIVSVDGGINSQTAKLCKNAGANILVAGSSVFKDLKIDVSNALVYKNNIENLLKE
jgi:ribulose-phosphate 3-epimerase